jgi:hypothetical protein
MEQNSLLKFKLVPSNGLLELFSALNLNTPETVRFIGSYSVNTIGHFLPKPVVKVTVLFASFTT